MEFIIIEMISIVANLAVLNLVCDNVVNQLKVY